MSFSIKQLEELKNTGKIRGFTIISKSDVPGDKPKGSKYGNVKTVVDGIEFDSAKEAGRYLKLRYLLIAGEISDLKMQVDFELNEGGSHSLKYRADFVYTTKDGTVIVEDVKGFRTREYKKKKRLMLKVLGIEIKEV